MLARDSIFLRCHFMSVYGYTSDDVKRSHYVRIISLIGNSNSRMALDRRHSFACVINLTAPCALHNDDMLRLALFRESTKTHLDLNNGSRGIYQEIFLKGAILPARCLVKCTSRRIYLNLGYAAHHV